MNTLQKMEAWADTHHPKWIDFIRIALGIFILFKGIAFISDTDALATILTNSQFEFISLGLAHYVAFAHLVGGLFIAIGLLTRFAVLVQLPILIGAVLFVNAKKGFFSVNSELEVSLLVLIFLLFFLFYGSGKFSVDQSLKREK